MLDILTKTIVKGTLICMLIFLGSSSLYSIDYYVSVDGSDNNDGAIETPFKSINFALSQLGEGDRLFIRGGEYNETVIINSLEGSEDNPIIIAAYPGERVLLDGTQKIVGNWTEFLPDIYSIQIDFKGYQLFFNNRIMTAARFPNALWSDGSIFENHLACRHLAKGSMNGLMYDEDPKPHIETDVYDEGAEQSASIDTFNTISVGESGIDFTGAVVVLHLGSWLSWAQEVKKHVVGEDKFTYYKDFSKSGRTAASAHKYLNNTDWFNKKNIKTGQGYYFFEGLMCLDVEEEWWFDDKSNQLYFYAPSGVNPTDTDIKLKVKDYSLEINNSSHIVVKDLDFFGSTFNVTNSKNITIENSEVVYPSYNKFVLGDFRRPNVSSMIAKKGDETNYVLKNCTFSYADGPGIELRGSGNLVENCLFHHIDYTCLGTGGEGTVNIGYDVVFRQNTIYTAGNSEGIRPGGNALIEYNHVYDMSKIQHDGSLINAGVAAQDNTIVQYNWSHDTYKSAYRFDSSHMGDSTTVNYGHNGTMAYNVLWNVGPMKVKGENHKIFHNTAYKPNGKGEIGIAVLDNPNMGGFNRKTVVANNLGRLSGHFTRRAPSAGLLEANLEPDLDLVLRDPKNFDFRPVKGSIIINAGRLVYSDDKKDNTHVDIGAYSHDAENYWIPGYRASQASTPVPCNSCSNVKKNTDLMWLQAYKATIHDVYFGDSFEKIVNADPNEKEYLGRFENNIVTPTKLITGKTYFWRVDAILEDEIIKGEVWRFIVE